MTFTDLQLDALFTAYCLAAKGQAFVPTDEALSECEGLAEAGWLKRLEREDDTAFEWTQQAETALEMRKLMDFEGREN